MQDEGGSQISRDPRGDLSARRGAAEQAAFRGSGECGVESFGAGALLIDFGASQGEKLDALREQKLLANANTDGEQR